MVQVSVNGLLATGMTFVISPVVSTSLSGRCWAVGPWSSPITPFDHDLPIGAAE